MDEAEEVRSGDEEAVEPEEEPEGTTSWTVSSRAYEVFYNFLLYMLGVYKKLTNRNQFIFWLIFYSSLSSTVTSVVDSLLSFIFYGCRRRLGQ